MEKIDLTYLKDELADQSAGQLKQLFQNDGEAIVAAINKQLKEAKEDDDVIFTLSHSIKIDLSDMKIKGKLAFSVKRSTELETAIMDPDQPELNLSNPPSAMGAAGTGDSGAPDTVEDEGDEDELVPAGDRQDP